MWTSPIYKFREPDIAVDSDSIDLHEIVFDVTLSAPPFKEPSEGLKEILNELLKRDDIDSVLEFGAAKLKNIPFILSYSKSVCVVEFKELLDNSITKKNIVECKKYGDRFQKLLFPNPFIEDNKEYDLVLLLNVIPVMPIPAERMYLLDLIYHKVKDKKYVLWVAQKEGSYKKIREDGKNSCGDGIWMGKSRYFKTFYRYYPVEELDELMALYGFELVKRFSVSDDARLYRKTDYNLFTGIITPEKILQYIPEDNTIKDPNSVIPKIVTKSSTIKPIIANPNIFSIESLYIEKIRNINKGVRFAEEYHRIVSHALARIFRGSLRNMIMKVNIDGGIKIVDTVFSNYATQGFFKNLKDKVECSYPIFEVKNISVDPQNTEFDQLNGRLNDNTGHFGILVCRSVEKEQDVIQRCKTFRPNNLILYLTDDDIITLLEYSREKNVIEIDNFMDVKLRNILF